MRRPRRILLLRRRPSAYVLTAMILVSSVCMGAALTGMVAWSAVAAGRSIVEAAPFVIIPAAAATLTVLFFRRARDADDLGRDHRGGEPQRVAA